MPPYPISTLTTLVIPLFFVLGLVSAPPGVAGPLRANTAAIAPGDVDRPPERVGACSGSACALRRVAPRVVDEGFAGNLPAGRGGVDLADPCAPVGIRTVIPAGCGGVFERTPLDLEHCEYVGPAPFFMSPSDSEFCGLVTPAPLSLPPVGAGE